MDREQEPSVMDIDVEAGPSSSIGILSIESFITIVEDWVLDNLKSIDQAWATLYESEGGGDSWETWAKLQLKEYFAGRYIDVDLGAPAKVYSKPRLVCDFFLNATVASSMDQKVVVEITAQRPGKPDEFWPDFRSDIAKLRTVALKFSKAQRLAVGFFFTQDPGLPPRVSGGKVKTSPATRNFADDLNAYDAILVGEGRLRSAKAPSAESGRMETDEVDAMLTDEDRSRTDRTLRLEPGDMKNNKALAAAVLDPRGAIPFSIGICWKVVEEEEEKKKSDNTSSNDNNNA
jgi:hypothetical protein